MKLVICYLGEWGRETWYNSVDINERIKGFVRYPSNEETLEPQKQHQKFLKKLETALKAKKWCKKLEYTGSSYEGLKSTEGGLEFDIMFIIDGSDLCIDPLTDCEGYAYLKIKPDDEANVSIYEKFVDCAFLSPSKLIDIFFGTVQTCVNAMKLGDQIKVRRHGPAVQIDVTKQGEEFYSVDLVPSVEVHEGGNPIKFLFHNNVFT